MKRIGERVDREIPPSQAAYRKGRSTTEHFFCTKLIIERTITSKNESVYLIMHDMSKAFDSINRATLIKYLEKILQKDELHLINTMLNVELSVKFGLHHSNYFNPIVHGGGGKFTPPVGFFLITFLWFMLAC